MFNFQYEYLQSCLKISATRYHQRSVSSRLCFQHEVFRIIKTYSTYSSYFHDHSSMHRAGKMSHAGSIPVVFSLRKPLPPAQRTRFPGGKLIRARALKLIGTYRHAGIEFQQCQGLTGPSSKFSWGESRKPGISQRAGPKGCHLDQDAVGC